MFFATTIYEEIPIRRGLGYESDLLPPPFGTADQELYDLARSYGIKISFSADYLYPLERGGIDPSFDPLQALVDAGAADIIHSIANYDEPAWNGIDPSVSRELYLHVKSLLPQIPVLQVHAPVTESDPTDYLDAVKDHAEWADIVGFNVYPIADPISGARTPYTPDAFLSPGAALEEYVDWLEAEFPDKLHTMVLQTFERAELYTDGTAEFFEAFSDTTSRDPTFLEMREMLIAVEDVDTVFWWGGSLQDTEADPVWQNALTLSEIATEGNLNVDMRDLRDVYDIPDTFSEDASANAFVGVRLYAYEADEKDIVTFSVDDDRFFIDQAGRIRVAPESSFDFETEPSITITATAESTDGTVSTLPITFDVTDVVDRIDGSAGADALLGASGEDFLSGLGANDILNGLEGNDTIEAGNGNDYAYGGTGDDVLRGRTGDDILFGQTGDDTLYGGWGADYLVGGTGNDWLDGGLDNDNLIAEAGTNTFIGGRGDDMMQGGSGSDTFVLNTKDGNDQIYQFDLGMDVLSFKGELTRDDLDIETIGDTVTIDYSGGSVALLGVGEDAEDEIQMAFM